MAIREKPASPIRKITNSKRFQLEVKF